MQLEGRHALSSGGTALAASPEVSPAGSQPHRALIVDIRAVLGTEICRSLTKQGWHCDVFAEPGSPTFRSRSCARRFLSPPIKSSEALLKALDEVIESGGYDAIFLCNETILELLVDTGNSARWPALLLSRPSSLKCALSKNAMIQLAADLDVPVPETVIPDHQSEAPLLAKRIGLPLVIKGEKGEAGYNVRIAWRAEEIPALYAEVANTERVYNGRPALQEFIPGPQYSIGGLFRDGVPLRVCAYRKIFTYPLYGGLTAKTITERPAKLLETAFAIFGALRYTGLGQMQFIRDSRNGQFKFLELNPRVWACIGLAQHAGVDLYTPYAKLVSSKSVSPNLEYQLGVRYRRFSVKVRLLIERPWQLPRVLKDCLDPRVRSDFDWRDPGPHLLLMPALKLLLGKKAPSGAAEWPKSL
jgi:carbamoylphosphate synthase large subunit